ncbi:hypothetical protein B0A48_07102 [Cryoendolithus antarcticus]|uniref:Sodium/calcium exchanger membrane region domain-containing protein n=1 Tax=Cryoendolithus antarcticus TaxID=1507870 RepID=A0A1V8T7M5_9PEZI|nr:hypothetical protein B0A48_07102 [Cryoendolithus antarcticus]
MRSPNPPPPHAPGTRMPTKRNKYRSARAFYLFVLIGFLLALAAWNTNAAATAATRTASDTSPAHLFRRDGFSAALNDDEECRLVHRSPDQCAFIKEHCPDDEAGFTVYLNLYYCRLHNAKPVAFMILISWLGLLFSTIGIAASDFFCINLSTIANLLGMSESMAGVTLLAFGNGSPDVFSTFSAMSTNSGSLAVGELMGAAGFITAVVAGSMALIKPFHVARKSFVRDVGFFIVAAAFSLVFLWDGRLHLWECITMVGYYCFYVAFVVAWHWWIGRRRKRRETMAAARGHFVTPGDGLEEDEQYHDEPGETTARPTLSRGASRDDFAALERGGGTPNVDDLDEDEEEEARDRWMSELNSNMRLARPRVHSRRNTITPVRPSLVGALEFQAVLNSLQKSRNHQTIPLNSRRYSDDPNFTTAQQQDYMSTEDDPANRPPYQIPEDLSPHATVVPARPNLSVPLSAPAGRSRAVSANDASSLRIDSDLHNRNQDVERTGDLIDFSEDGSRGRPGSAHLDVPQQRQQPLPETPTFEISSPPIEQAEEFHMPMVTPDLQGRQSPDHLAAFNADGTLPNRLRSRSSTLHSHDSPHDSPRTVPHARQLPRIVIPRDRRSRDSTPSSTPFPAYKDPLSTASSRAPSLYLPPPIASPESVPPSQPVEQALESRPLTWWPYKLLPPPGALISTLFPTIYHWQDKSIWEKMIGIVAAPSVFLLTITLPVVESDKGEEESLPPAQHASYDSARRSIGNILDGSMDTYKRSLSPDPVTPGSHIHHSFANGGPTGMGNSAALAAATEAQYRHNYGSMPNDLPSVVVEQPHIISSPAILPSDGSLPNATNSEPWPRWLAILHLYTAPVACILSVYLQQPDSTAPTWLLIPLAGSLGSSTLLLLPFLWTTTSQSRPGGIHRALFSAAGFIVSIAWISSIADQVVGALKALAVICNMSHAIMGLTIFAVGNSLGDLVADVTVARLGYPVMALSACFGGPMLNILLGIGLSGTYIQLSGAQRRQHKHPGSGLKFKAYHIDVGRTLIVSGVTLVITLVGLLIFVPVSGWVLSRRIGWALIAVWTISTIGNVALELSGWGTGVGSEG